ncbi:MAG: hypothetical protein C4B59_13600 [Candidatus Methanogaster sp.]|uniref:Uncharacterized protein n=1 Tax=Candidatus Methanogaster sp. TaxID=3386292 RepID=A0AC61L022_9EURY|nr:MAG: hypothetical protein C4B59_13600 [ANME-2 cluster archaeon]
MEKKKNIKKKFGAVSALMIAGLLASLCGIAGANSEFDAPITASDPTIDFIHVPEYSNPDNEDLEGNVTGVAYGDYRIAVYIRVGDLWWTKPYYASPLTTINPNGTWTCDITTGGYDRYATAVAAYLLPAGVEPPICGPCYELPVILGAVACVQQELLEPRTISFAGYDWTVKRRDFCDGPGPNYFSDKEEDIWVDNEGLHMTISEHDGRWYCTEAILNTSLGYGTYTFQTHGQVDIIDPLMVLGLFTWDGVAEEQNHREMDIEFARWGDADEYTNAQYVVQPCSQCPGCDDLCTRFRVNLTDKDSNLTHYLVWSPGTVEFSTYYGSYTGSVPQASALVHKWAHASKYVPEPGNENIRFNFWLHEGNAPASSQGDEVVITNFTWQEKAPVPPGYVVTNLINYPIAGYFEGAGEVRIDDVPVTMDYYGGFRRDVVLNNGINSFKIDAIRGGEIYESVFMEINYDPELSTEDRTLLYSYGDPAKTETIVLDLDGGYILGVLSGVNIVATTHDGRHVVDTKGNVYQTSDHTVVGERLPFSQTTSYPVFSNDDSLCYAGNEKVRFADRALVSDQFPVEVDGRFARLLPGNLLIQGSNYCFWKINLINDEVVDEIGFSKKRVLWGTSAVAPCGDFGFITSYSYAHGALDIIGMETGNKTSEFDLLSDYMGQISFSTDRSKAFVGSYGNSYYGKGGIYVIDLGTQTKLSYYKQFGASSVEVGPDGFVYISSRYVVHSGAKGSKYMRGIDVLLLNEDCELQFIKTYYLNYGHHYSTKPTFFIKPVGAPTELPDMKIIDAWVDNSTIYYKVKNIGGKKAGTSETSLTVDGVFVASDSVASLDSGVERTESFNCTWDCSNLSYTIEVCADCMDDVEEYSHSNNCLTETWICPDLMITDVWFVNNSIIYYKMKNAGGITAGASNTSLIADGVSEALDSVVSLEPGVERTESFNYTWICTNPNDTITVCADCTSDVAESNETNNCRTETLVCPPDILVSPTSFDVRLGLDVVSNYTLTIGNNWIGVLEFNVSEVEDYHVTSQIGWPQETGGYVHSSPALGDIDGDGDLEVVVGSKDDRVYAWHHDGSTVTGWPKRTFGGDVSFSPALGDIDGDGDIEIVVGSDNYKVYAWHHTGSTVTGWPKKTNYYVRSSPALGDIDGDGDIEIVVGSCDRRVYAWHHDGSAVTGWPKKTGGYVYSSPALGDIDGDGDIEVVVGSASPEGNHKVYAWHHDGSTVTGWPKKTGSIHSSPALGDIDGDGDIEIVVSSTNKRVYAWHHDGSAVTGWPKKTGGKVYSSPALGDIDGDGGIEIVVSSMFYHVCAWHHDGSTVTGWPKRIGRKLYSSPVLGDIDGDGYSEVLVGSSRKVYAWHHTGSTVTGWPKETGGKVYSSPAISDIDGDGDIEVVVGSNDNKVYVWDCSGIYNPNNIEWGTFHHDVRRTGLYEAKLPKKGGWLSESPTNGTVYPDSQTTINVTFSTAGLPSGEYSANITITSNDPDENQAVIPVRLNVTPSQKGDLNHDGEITPADAVIALRIAVNDGYASEADVDGNGCVNVLDALMIMQAAAGAISL